MTTELIRYINQYGGFCRDCSDNDGVCPTSGMPCDPKSTSAVIKHTLAALKYGIEHGFIENPFVHAAPNVPETATELKPCPFCGGEAEIERYGCTRYSTVYRCQDCGCALETSETFNHGREWNTRAVPDLPELVRYDNSAFTDGSPSPVLEITDGGRYVLYDQVAAIIAAKDGEFQRMKIESSKHAHDAETVRRERDALIAKLAEYEKQKPIGFVKALEVAEGAFNSWETKTHNFKWAKRLEGTPITNDVTVAMAQYFSRYYASPAPMESEK